MHKRLMTLFLVLAIVCSFTTMALATDTTTVTVKTTLDRANVLKDLSILSGIAGFDLAKPITKTEAVVIYIRLLGKDSEAKISTYKNPFTDVPTWASKYIAYANSKGLASGTSKTTFGSNYAVTPEQFLTFMLKALGYNDNANGDFTSKTVIQKAEKLGIIPSAKYKAGAKLTRSNSVEIIYSALGVNKKAGKVTLAKSLVDSKVIDAAKAEKYGFIQSTPASTPTPTPAPTSTPTPKPQYQMVQVNLANDATFGWVVKNSDIKTAIPGAKYVTYDWSDTIGLSDYEKAYGIETYKDLIDPNKSAWLENDLMNGMGALNCKEVKSTSKLVATVYDEKENMIAAAIISPSDAEKTGYVKFALISVDVGAVVANQNAAFNAAFGKPSEYQGATVKIEKALINWTFISKKTGKVVSAAKAADIPNSKPYYRYVIDSDKYPDLAKNAKYIGDSDLPSGMSVSDAVKTFCFNWFNSPNYDGSFSTTCLVSDFANYSNNWTQTAASWNNPRYIMFADANKRLIGFTSIIPSQMRVIDVGTVDQTAYVN